ncbi:hypothetical protein AKJ16_DCAP22918 [Drosera capensis]
MMTRRQHLVVLIFVFVSFRFCVMNGRTDALPMEVLVERARQTGYTMNGKGRIINEKGRTVDGMAYTVRFGDVISISMSLCRLGPPLYC